MKLKTKPFMPGFEIAYVSEEVPGAFANGTRVRKANSEAGDTNVNGTAGAVLGSMTHPVQGLAYFVAWDSAPDMPVLCVARKVEVEQ